MSASQPSDRPRPVQHPDFRNEPLRPELSELMLRVESLGVSCELGLVQSHCKAQPLGMFRFGNTPLMGLIAAMRAGFADIDAPELLEFHEGFSREWFYRHARYGFESHTHRRAPEVTEDEVRQQVQVRLGFLGRRMIDDLAAAEKLFVYRPEISAPVGAEAMQLSAAMRAHGDAVLLWVEEDPARAGSAVWTVPGSVMTGFIDRFAPTRFAVGASFYSWCSLIESAVALLDVHRGQEAA